MPDVTDDVVIVTGASRGLGKSVAERLSGEGARVVLTATDEERLQAVADEMGGDALVVPADVRDADAVDRVVEETGHAFGPPDSLVNNAGISPLSLHDERRSILEMTESEWDQIIDVNLTGVFLFTKAVLPHMYERGSGNVINVSSALGRVATAGAAAYVSSKWGLEGFTRVVAQEGEDRGVNANAIDPGGRVNTDIWNHLPESERQEILQPDVMDDAIVLLAGQGPGGVSGETHTAAEWEDVLA
ncbi:MAG: SDR family NAD(P)-dependent oxidoreductase [Halodesulfurarchaeum sp.]